MTAAADAYPMSLFMFASWFFEPIQALELTRVARGSSQVDITMTRRQKGCCFNLALLPLPTRCLSGTKRAAPGQTRMRPVMSSSRRLLAAGRNARRRLHRWAARLVRHRLGPRTDLAFLHLGLGLGIA